MKTRVLWVSEASVLNTGYAVYSREILKRLFENPDIDVAEFAAYLNPRDGRIREIPWRIYPNLPDPDNEEANRHYMSEPTNQFGAWKFEEVVHDYLPHVVCGISDFWMQSFIGYSPYRPYYHWAWMPTVDAEHQDVEWLSLYKEVDSLFTYQDWSLELLKRESNNSINAICSAPPCADEAFKPLENRDQLKKSFGLDGYTVFGTVMRNQRRKLYPSLFKTFREYLNKTGDGKTLLYCHTSYPDRGWDIPALLLEHGLSNKVLFTYVCKNCGSSFPSFFNDALAYCSRCNQPSAVCANVHHGVNNQELSAIYNIFDLYIQYANCEGFGMPVVEAAACGIPVAATNYSALEDILNKLEVGYKIGVQSKEVELETGRLMAIPDDNSLVEYMIEFKKKTPDEVRRLGQQIRVNYLKHYNWNNTANIWASAVRGIDVEKADKLWYSQPNLRNPAREIPQGLSNEQFARFLILNVLCEPRFCNSFMEARLIKDLNYNITTQHIGGMYFNEMSMLFTGQNHQKQFTRQEAYDTLVRMRAKINYWEQMRAMKLGLK